MPTLNRFTRFAAGLILSLVVSSPAHAQVRAYTLTLVGGSSTYTGGFSFNYPTPGESFISFSQFVSFQIAVDGETYVLANALSPFTDGLVVTPDGQPMRFGNLLSGLPAICPQACESTPLLVFLDGTNDWALLGENERGTYSFAPAEVPEPASLALLGLGLAGIGVSVARRRLTA